MADTIVKAGRVFGFFRGLRSSALFAKGRRTTSDGGNDGNVVCSPRFVER